MHDVCETLPHKNINFIRIVLISVCKFEYIGEPFHFQRNSYTVLLLEFTIFGHDTQGLKILKF